MTKKKSKVSFWNTFKSTFEPVQSPLDPILKEDQPKSTLPKWFVYATIMCGLAFLAGYFFLIYSLVVYPTLFKLGLVIGWSVLGYIYTKLVKFGEKKYERKRLARP